jgi:acyl-CoA synthetase (AMP-forming)/AMP-acid ligase II/pimeloyl-ACP methyl ester carboxylesterase
VTFAGAAGDPVTWHVLDTGSGPKGTVVCVHGNPTWGYLWVDLLRTLAPAYRVIAVDQTSMGFSEHSSPRRLAERVEELVSFCRQEVGGPLLLAAHDWGGPIAVGASEHLDVRALILANTAVAQPDDVRTPPLISVARRLVDLVCRRTPLFVEGTARMTDRRHRAALRAPYRGAQRRTAVADFVADIPLDPAEPSMPALQRSAKALDELDCPILLLWGGRDPVFHDRFLREMRRRVPQAQVERFAHAGHLVCLDEPIGGVVGEWLERVLDTDAADLAAAPEPTDPGFTSVLSELAARVGDDSLLYLGPDGMLSWSELARRSDDAASALLAAGLAPGDRVALLIPPSPDMLVAAAGTWKAGGVLVAADASAGLRRLRRLLRASESSYVLGTPATLALARAAGFAPGARAAAFASLPTAIDLRRSASLPAREQPAVDPDALAAVVHTSGATGPSKAVRYRHRTLSAQRDALRLLIGLAPGQAFATSYGPFLLLAASLGRSCVRPDFSPDEPSQLTFDALDAALRRAEVSTAWLSPAAAESLVATADGRTCSLELVLLAGAPIPPALARAVGEVTGAEVRAPYGMTECLVVTDGVDPLVEGPHGGTSTGRPLAGCDVAVVPLDDPRAPTLAGAAWGEILVHAPWMLDGYEARFSADAASAVVREGRRFHRTGDVGYLHEGRLFQLGRAQHVLRCASGPLPSVQVEEPVAAALGRAVAAVGIGPAGSEVIALVLADTGELRLAPAELASQARAAAGQRLAAVLVGALPTDRRHQSKVDRAALSRDAATLLAGR